jgi:lipoprotein signal peptidase
MKDYLFIIFLVAFLANTGIAFSLERPLMKGIALTFLQAIVIALVYGIYIIFTAV